jgi:hypothetical protein
VYRSDDRGGRWTRVAYAGFSGGARTGNLPFWLGHGRDHRRYGELTLLPDGRLFAAGGRTSRDLLGRYENTFTLWCSVDGGRTWAVRCAR